jgi:segregation and condensation protein A
MDQGFKIKTEIFEGPLELLLNLIEKRKLFINDIALSKVTDDFIAYVKNFENFPIADSANFILIASTLLLIKSKSLLPTLDLTEEEQASIEDLEARLKIYARMKELSVHVKECFGKNMLFAKENNKIEVKVFSPHAKMTLPNLVSAIFDVIKNFPRKEVLPKAIVRKVISLEDMIGRLTERITSSLRMSFREFASVNKEEKVHVIISFLAMLELVKQGVINVMQEQKFDDIKMETAAQIGVPKY